MPLRPNVRVVTAIGRSCHLHGSGRSGSRGRNRGCEPPIAERLGLTHFVDDKLEVLGYLTSVPHRFLFRPRPAEVAARRALLPLVHRVESWPELTSLLRAD